MVLEHGSTLGLDGQCVGHAYMSNFICVPYACGLCACYVCMVVVMVVIVSPRES